MHSAYVLGTLHHSDTQFSAKHILHRSPSEICSSHTSASAHCHPDHDTALGSCIRLSACATVLQQDCAASAASVQPDHCTACRAVWLWQTCCMHSSISLADHHLLHSCRMCVTCSGVVLCWPLHQHGQSAPAVNGSSTRHCANHCKNYHARMLLHMRWHRHTCPHLSMLDQSTNLMVLLISLLVGVQFVSHASQNDMISFLDRHSLWQQQVQADCNQEEAYLEVWEFGHMEQTLCGMHAAFCRCTRKHSYQSRDASTPADGLFPAPIHSASYAYLVTRGTAATD